MEDYMPQDEYFEWEDIMGGHDRGKMVETGAVGPHLAFPDCWTSSQDSSDSSDADVDDGFAWSESSDNSTPPSPPRLSSIQKSLSFDPASCDAAIDFPSYDDDDDDDDDDRECPVCSDSAASDSHGSIQEAGSRPHSTCAVQDSPRCPGIADASGPCGTQDDSAISLQPWRQVNYLSHEWVEEDCCCSWRHNFANRKALGDPRSIDISDFRPYFNAARLENASWRSWAKLRFALDTVSPDIINWKKSIDDTCLHGPFSVATHHFAAPTTSSPYNFLSCQHSKSSRPRKQSSPTPIRKPRASELLLRGSLPTFSIWRGGIHVTDLIANQTIPIFAPSKLNSKPLSRKNLKVVTAPRRSVKFVEEVEQYVILQKTYRPGAKAMVRKIESATLPAMQMPSSPWSPDSLGSHNAESPVSPSKSEWAWLGEEDAEKDAEKLVFSDMAPRPKPTSAAAAPILIGNGSLAHSYKQILDEVHEECTVDDELDYLLSCDSLSAGSLSPDTSYRSSSGSSDNSDSDDDAVFDTVDVTETVKEVKTREERPNYGLGMEGLMDCDKQALYEQVMDEYELYC